MTVTVTHTKVDQIPDWAQAELDRQIALGNYPAGTTLAQIVLPSDWNAAHTLDGMDILEDNINGVVVIDMEDADKILTVDESQQIIKVFINSGDGTKEALYPTTSDGKVSGTQIIFTAFAGNNFFLRSETGGIAEEIQAPEIDFVGYSPGLMPQSNYMSTVSQDAYTSSWDGSQKAPTQNAVYDKIESMVSSFSQTFLLMGG